MQLLYFYIDNQRSVLNTNNQVFCCPKTCKLQLQPHTSRYSYENELNTRIYVKSGKMVNTVSHSPFHCQLQHIGFGYTTQGSIFLCDNRLLDEHVTASPKSFPSPFSLPSPSYQSCQKFYCKIKVTSQTEIWPKISSLLGYKIK